MNKLMNNYRILKFDTAKFILIMAIVLLHALVTFVSGPERFKAVVRLVLLGCTMPLFTFILFTFISGFFFSGTLSLRKLLRQSWLFICFNSLGNMFAWLHGFSERFNLTIIAPVMWYLGAIIIYEIVYSALNHVDSRWLIVVSEVIFYSMSFLPYGFANLFWGRVFGFLPFFIVGKMAADHQWINKEMFVRPCLCRQILILAVFALFLGGLALYRPWVVNSGVSHRAFGGGGAGVMIKMIFQFFAVLYGWTLLRLIPNRFMPVTLFGRRTMVVYLCHVWIVLIFAALVRDYSPLHPWYIRYPVMTISVALTLLLFHGRVSGALSWFAKIPQKVLGL